MSPGEKCASDVCVFPGPPHYTVCIRFAVKKRGNKVQNDQTTGTNIWPLKLSWQRDRHFFFFSRFRLKDSKRINCSYTIQVFLDVGCSGSGSSGGTDGERNVQANNRGHVRSKLETVRRVQPGQPAWKKALQDNLIISKRKFN